MRRSLLHTTSMAGPKKPSSQFKDEIESARNRKPSVTKNVFSALETFFWLLISGLTLFYTDIVNALKVDSRVDSTACIFGFISIGTTFSIFLYLIVWCSWIKGIDSDDWETHAPYSIPVATFSGVVSSICWLFAFYGVYGLKTPFILFILFMGFVTLVSLLPPWSSEVTFKKDLKEQKDD